MARLREPSLTRCRARAAPIAECSQLCFIRLGDVPSAREARARRRAKPVDEQPAELEGPEGLDPGHVDHAPRIAVQVEEAMAVLRAIRKTAALRAPGEVQDEQVPVQLDGGLAGTGRERVAGAFRRLAEEVLARKPSIGSEHQVGQGRRDRGLLHALRPDGPLWHTGASEDQRDMQGVGVQALMVEPDPVSPQRLSVVRGEGDDRVGEGGMSQDSPKGVIEVLDLPPVARRQLPS